ncbi:methyltransferase domain-containing protein [Kitasatospora sp. NBC_01266]|uniref:methyltransferase domain-containing protein n=1 Tax=Kitasatospora sp. NBC_01266 TaxID=2903572 RepID=UPI002E37AB6D|nr:methyltransferase domain-containing protein [Kitasatospora sp. NBC_01266]
MTTNSRAAELRRALADRLRASGAITSAAWHQAFATVPREAFVQAFAVGRPGGPVRLDPDTPDWLDMVYSDDSLLTQFDGNGVPTSSSTLPTLMALMLEALDVQPGNRVLEVATGTGYNAALLSHRLGSRNVVTIEVDPDLAGSAQSRLRAAGFTPTVVAGDGRAGHPGGGRYDRLIATCGMSHVPSAWLDQVRPGGLIVTPLGGGIARLRVEENGTASGTFLPDAAYFMPARSLATSMDPKAPPPLPDSYGSRPCALDPAVFMDERFHFLLTLTLSGAMQRFTHTTDGGIDTAHLWHEDGSWAELRGGIARESGPRRLLDLAEQALADFEVFGRPAREDYRLSVTKDEQWLWPRGSNGPTWRLAVAGITG